jgi:uncharacterized beta-barrel protein YwiB (DUF1934 family)
MMMKAKIKIESIIDNLDESGLIDGESEKSVSFVSGIYRYSDTEVRLSYKEKNDGGESEAEIVVIDGKVSVKRSGAIRSELHFEEGESHKSLYVIPPFRFDAEVFAKRVRASLSEEGGHISLLYDMKIGGADKSAIMRIWISKA